MSFFSDRPATATHRLLSAAAGVNATSVVARPSALKGVQGHNANAAARFLKLYNKASAPSEADTPVKTIYLAPTATFAFDFAAGIEFPLGIGYRLTTGGADNDTGALTAADVLCLNIDYV